MDKFTLYIADDHQLIVDGLKQILALHETCVIIGTANDGEKALKDILSLKPDIALLDIRMPLLDGMKLLQILDQEKCQTRTILLSMYEEVSYINQARKYGAYGYLLKNTGRKELQQAIEQVRLGLKVFHEIEPEESDQIFFLTPRERDVIKLVFAGDSNQTIALKLNVSVQTVITHRRNIREKTGASNVSSLNKVLQENGIYI